MKKIKVLAIAPYEGLKDTILDVAALRKDVEVDVHVADMQEGADYVSNMEDREEYEVIISRGGTVGLIRKVTETPIVEISISIYDILRGIKMVETFAENYVIVGFRSFTSCAVILCNLMQYNVEIYTITSEKEIEGCLDKIQTTLGGQTVILCDKITNSYAQKMGLTAILITSGSESVDAAFTEAVQLSRNNREINALFRCLYRSFECISDKLLVYREDGREMFSAGLEIEQRKWLRKVIIDYFGDFGSVGEGVCCLTHKGIFYEIIMEKLELNNRNYYNFYIKMRKNAAVKKDDAITQFNYKDLLKQKQKSFHHYISFTGNMAKELNQYAGNKEPIVFVGEVGTGKDNGAKLLYEQGMLRNRPLITIDGKKLKERQWKFLFFHEDSPLYNIGVTIYFKNINSFQIERYDTLIHVLADGEIQNRNKLIFSIVLDGKEETNQKIKMFTNVLSFPVLYFPALRERAEKIPVLAGLYINEMNTVMGKQVIGFEPAAMDLLKGYNWPYNLGQFKRVIKELVIMTQTPYITYTTLLNILKKESSGNKKNQEGKYSLNLSQTLKEIEREVIQIVLEEENGNQSAAARRLGISRGTLWRMMKEQ